MRTKGEALTDKIEDSIIKINNTISNSYTEDSYSEIVKILGGEIEKFLKKDVLNVVNKNFYELIEELNNLHINPTHISNLHNFRLCYNGYKHDPNYSKTIFEVKEIFEKLKLSLEEITNNNLGTVNLPYQSKSKRIVWFAGWDDYIGGMVECNIFIPDYNSDMPKAIEHFNIDWRAWDIIINKFTQSNELYMGKEYVSDKAYKFWKAQSDFLGAGQFVGEISDFIRELVKNIAVNENDLIPFLKRNHDSHSVFCSIVFSLYDALREDKWQNSLDLKDEIILRMSYDYGVDFLSPYLSYLDYVDFENIKKNRLELRNTFDILWVDDITYDKKKYGIISEKLKIAFDKDYNMVINLNK